MRPETVANYLDLGGRSVGQLGVDLGGNLFGLDAGLGDLAADGLAAIAVVEPSRRVVDIERRLAHMEARGHGPLTGRHGTNSHVNEGDGTRTRNHRIDSPVL